MQTAELLLDAVTEAAVVEQWQRLVAADLPSQARHTGSTNRPHVSLAVAGEMPDALDALLAAAAVELPLPVLLGPLVVLGGRRHVLARLLVPTPALLTLHAGVAVATAGCPDRSELLRPGTWTPHVTLARGLDGGQVAAALAALDRLPALDARATGLRRFDGDARTTRLVAGTDERAEPS